MQGYDQQLAAAAARIGTLREVSERERLAAQIRADAAADRRDMGKAALVRLGRWLVETGQHLQAQYGGEDTTFASATAPNES